MPRARVGLPPSFRQVPVPRLRPAAVVHCRHTLAVGTLRPLPATRQHHHRHNGHNSGVFPGGAAGIANPTIAAAVSLVNPDCTRFAVALVRCCISTIPSPSRVRLTGLFSFADSSVDTSAANGCNRLKCSCLPASRWSTPWPVQYFGDTPSAAHTLAAESLAAARLDSGICAPEPRNAPLTASVGHSRTEPTASGFNRHHATGH